MPLLPWHVTRALTETGRNVEVVNGVNPKKTIPIEIADPFARKLVGQYLENRESDIQKLREALRLHDFDAIRVTGHNLFGSGSAYGLDEVSRIGARLEQAASEQGSEEICRLVAELADYLRDVDVH
ncbi:MAG: Hpt domain-containing protein [Chromatiales bacterium]|nr:MAG: Hpt domain-containing protein [Chromatiales bacterium]